MFRIKFNSNVVLWKLLHLLYNDDSRKWTSENWESNLRGQEFVKDTLTRGQV